MIIIYYIKWMWLYFLLYINFRKYNHFSIFFKIDNNTANFNFKFNLKDNPILSFWYSPEDNAIIFFAVTKKCGKYYHEIHSLNNIDKPSEILKYLKMFIPEFVSNYDTIYSEDRDTISMNIDNMIKGIERRNKIDSFIISTKI